MDAATQTLLRADDWLSRESSHLTPEACHLLPSGNRMPLLGLGTWHLTHHTVDSLCSALELGYRMIDTSEDYHTQRGIGEAIRACGFDRDDLYIVTKVDPDEDGYVERWSPVPPLGDEGEHDTGDEDDPRENCVIHGGP